MSDYEDAREEFVEGLRESMPSVPQSGALERVRSRAISRNGKTDSRPAVSGRWRVAGVALAAVAVVAVSVLVLAPRLETAAFARDQAADALLLRSDGHVLHAVMRYTETGWNEREGHDPRYDWNQRWSFWVDAEGKRTREEFVNLADGSLDGLSVRIGDRFMRFQNNIRYGTGSKQQLIDETLPDEPVGTVMGYLIDYMRARISDGSARAVGTRTIDGEEYWVVEYEEPQTEELRGKSVTTVTMRKSDYRVKTWARDAIYKNGDGKGTQTQRLFFETLEQLEPDSLPEDFFSFDEVIDAAKPGTPIEKR